MTPAPGVLRKAFKDIIPVMTGYLVLGLGYGIILQSKGYGALWALATSALIYAGSIQYVAIDLLAGGASLITAALTTLMVNARHLFYGLSMVGKYKGAGWKKPYLIFALTDETYSLVCRDMDLPEKSRHRYDFFVSLFDQIYWVSGCVLGALIGGVLPFSVEGIDFALTALFVTVFVEQWLQTRDHTAAIVGVGSSILCLLLFGADSFLIPTMAVITLALTLLRRKTYITYLGKMLPYAIMGMLVIYCLRSVSFGSTAGWLPALLSCLVVTLVHLAKRSTLLSILSGTVCYMLLVQLVF